MQNRRVPPYNLEAETAVLGAVLLNNDCWDVVRSILDSGDFYSEAYRRIFQAMEGLVAAGVKVDHVTLGNKLRDKGELEKVGGAIVLSRLTDAVATTASVAHYADIVHEKSAIRQVMHDAQEVVSQGFSGEGVDELSQGLINLMDSAQRLARKRMPMNLHDLGDAVLENYRKVAEGYRGIELPWPSLDNMTAGLWPKTVTVFVARPGTGKTFIAVICAKHAWEKGKRVLIVSPEMDKESIAERFFVIKAAVNYHHVITGALPTKSHERFESTIKECKGLPGLYIMDSEDDLSPRGIDAAIRACQPELVAIDSMYDLDIEGDRKDRILRALEWMKSNSKKRNYASLGFAQQNRVAEMAEKKGGGSRLGTIALADEIGQDAQTVIAIEQSKDDSADKILKLRPLKIRRGQFRKTVLRVNWDFETMRVDEIPDKDDKYADDDIPF